MNGFDVACWHFCDKARSLINFGFGWKSGREADIAPVAGIGPEAHEADARRSPTGVAIRAPMGTRRVPESPEGTELFDALSDSRGDGRGTSLRAEMGPVWETHALIAVGRSSRPGNG
jgi:hypothetical protein